MGNDEECINKKSLLKFLSEGFAEREGFEPPVPLGTTVFKTVVIDHSTISPNSVWMTIAWFS